MAIPNQTPYNIFNANGISTVFPYEFYLLNAFDLTVSINGAVQTTGFTVLGIGNVDGGQVVFLTPPANGSVILLQRLVPTYRLTEYQDNGDLLADTVNKDFDRLWMAIQQAFLYLGLTLNRPLLGGPFNAMGYRIENLADPINAQDAATKNYVDATADNRFIRTLRVPESSVAMLPSASVRSNKILAFNSAGDPISVLPESGSAANVMIELASAEDGRGDALITVKQPFIGAVARTQHDRNANTVYLSDFAYTNDISVAIQSALNYLESVGGGRLICQSGTFDAVTTVSKTITTRITIELNGTWIRKTQEGHTLYIVLANDTAGLEITGTGIFYGSFPENSTYASALVVLGGNGIRALSISSSVGFVGWAAGRFNAFITLNGVSEVHMNGVYIRGGSATNRTTYGILILSEYAPSLSHSYHALDIARCEECIYAYSTTSPGIEGLKFIDCDFTSAKHAVNYVHTLGTGYYPPQIEIINCHSNTHSYCYKIEKALNVKIMGGLQYRGGYPQPDFPSQLTDGWVYLKNTQDNVIATSLVMAGGAIDANPVTMENCALTRIHGCLFQNTSNKSAVKIKGTNSSFFLSQDNIKTNNGGWFDESEMIASPLTIRIEKGIELTTGIAADRALVNAEVSFSAGNIDVGKCRLGGVTIVGANSGNVISSITNVRNGYEYFIICLTPGVIIQHNTEIILSGGVNFTFTSQVNVITLRAENGIMRQISKQA
ncbi:phage tail fiber domain-containing protein [Serratia sp. D1N4]